MFEKNSWLYYELDLNLSKVNGKLEFLSPQIKEIDIPDKLDLKKIEKKISQETTFQTALEKLKILKLNIERKNFLTKRYEEINSELKKFPSNLTLKEVMKWKSFQETKHKLPDDFERANGNLILIKELIEKEKRKKEKQEEMIKICKSYDVQWDEEELKIQKEEMKNKFERWDKWKNWRNLKNSLERINSRILTFEAPESEINKKIDFIFRILELPKNSKIEDIKKEFENCKTGGLVCPSCNKKLVLELGVLKLETKK